MNQRAVLYYLIALSGLLTPLNTSWAQTTFNAANGHYYRLVRTESTWDEARVAAANESLLGFRGHLATITSAQEQSFIQSAFDTFSPPFVPMGEGVWLGGFQPAGSPEPAGNWQWVTGEPFVYINWQPGGEPSDFFDDEDLLQMWSGGYWNDIGPTDVHNFNSVRRIGYLMEFSIPEPSGLCLAGVVATCLIFRRSTLATA
jgi:hypothetical protein